ncbi:MAG: hypothetical protein ABSB29_07210 [Nitrososphaerales archaeon]|jgi:hypothetical protein
MEALVRNVSKLYWLLLILDIIVGLAVSKGYTQKYTDKLMGTSVVDAQAGRDCFELCFVVLVT